MSSEQIAERAKAEGRTGYGGWSRDRGLAAGPGHVLRFRVPEGKTTVDDMVRGEVVFDNANIEDFVIQRPDGSSLFILAVTIDDATMDITHVFRGEEHLANTPKQQLLWQALGYGELPRFGHLPVLVNEKRQKLSKRRDKVAMEQYQQEGYLPKAMANYLSLLGWAPSDDREILTRQEFIDEFRMEEVKSAPAFFDLVKMRDVNGKYIRTDLTIDQFKAATAEFMPPGVTWSRVDAMAPLVQERVELLSEVTGMVDFFGTPDDNVAVLHVDEDAAKAWRDDVAKLRAATTTLPLLSDVLSRFADSDFNAESTKDIVQSVGEAHGLKLGKAQAPVRMAVTGRRVGPPLFEAIEILGRNSVIARINAFVSVLQSGESSVPSS
jgi:glutamyl-tRNA synthetase